MLRSARQYFADQSVLEVDSPVLSRYAASDPHIESIAARLAIGSSSDYFLHTSPEFAMKRLLCAGYPDIYQICKVFRDGEVGCRHQPEFTMIEWYRRDFGLDEMIDDTIRLIMALLEPGHIERDAVQSSYRDVFLSYTGVDPIHADIATLTNTVDADSALATSIGDNRDDWLNLILSRDIATQFSSNCLTVLRHYPASQASLARICPDDASVADRFEVFCGSLELANGYVELTDASEQARRFRQDQQIRTALGRTLRPLDEPLLAAMQNGLPACAGVAVGFDRLLMINAQADDIRNVQSLPFEEPEIDPPPPGRCRFI